MQIRAKEICSVDSSLVRVGQVISWPDDVPVPSHFELAEVAPTPEAPITHIAGKKLRVAKTIHDHEVR